MCSRNFIIKYLFKNPEQSGIEDLIPDKMMLLEKPGTEGGNP